MPLHSLRSIAPVFAAVAALALPAAAAAGPPPTPGFATSTGADFFRPGFEPDVAIDKSPKTAGQIYTSTPFGFSTTQSFIYRSSDGGSSFHLVEGNFLGKPETCIGGGDSDIHVDPLTGEIYFSDLQGLTNFSNSTSTDSGRSWTTTCAAVNGAGVDRQWIGVDNDGGSKPATGGGILYEDYDNVDQNTDSDNLLGNQLVMNESLDGIHYGAGCQAAGLPCPLPPAVITRDEGIPGNVVVDNSAGPFKHTVYAVHTGGANESVIVSYCRGKAGDTTAAAVANDCTDPTQASMDPGHVNVNWHDSVVRAPGDHLTGNLFASMAVDQAGNLYVVWSEYPTDKSGNENGPGVVKLAVSTDGAKTWSGPFDVSPSTLGNNVMPWVAAGAPGRIGIAWYGAQEAEEGGVFGPDNLNKGVWNVYYAESIDALTGGPSFNVTQVSDHPAKFGNISTQGLGGSPDRSLGDFMQVQTGVDGGAVISYVDDTSADRNPDYCQGCGQSPPEAAGPIMIARQDFGESLNGGTLNGGPLPFGGVNDATGGFPDAFLSQAGSDSDVAKNSNMDITSVQVDQPDPSHVRIQMSTADPNLANDIGAPDSNVSAGGPVPNWLVRWAAPTYNAAGDGNQFYVGMQAGSGGAPQFFSGTTCAIGTTHTKYFTYPTTSTVPGSINGGTITWTVPLTLIGGPGFGQSMFSITGLTVTQIGASNSSASTGCQDPLSGSGDENIPNLIDASPPFTYTIGGIKAAPPTVQGFQLFTGGSGSGTTTTGTGSSGATTTTGVPGTICGASGGFVSTRVSPKRHGLRLSFKRRARQPVTLDVFQVSHGRLILGNRLIARFSNRSRSLTWGGRANRRHRKATDGIYFARFRMLLPNGRRDDRRVTLIRRHGRFHVGPAFYRRASCDEIESFKLERAAFGGRHNRAVGITYILRDDARVSVVVMRGKHVVRRYRTSLRRQHRSYRLRLPSEHLRRGNYRVRIQAVEPGRTTTATLTTRRL